MDVPPMQPPAVSDEWLTHEELAEAMELLGHFRSCVGAIDDVVMALLKTIIIRRDGSSRAVLMTLRSCCCPAELAS